MTVEDYYDYVGTRPFYSIRNRAIDSLPLEFRNDLYNFKFKRIKGRWHKWYRVSFSIDTTQEEIEYVLKENETFMHQFEDMVYKPIKHK